MKKVKINIIWILLLSLLTFTPGCQKDTINDEMQRKAKVVTSQNNPTEEDRLIEILTQARPHVLVVNGRLQLPIEAKDLLKLSTEDYNKIVKKLDFVNDNVLGKGKGVTAEDILAGKEYTTSYNLDVNKQADERACYGVNDIQFTNTWFVPTGVTIKLNSCNTDRLKAYGCVAAGGLIGIISSFYATPIGGAIAGIIGGVLCYEASAWLANNYCSYGIIMRGSVAYGFEYVECQPASCRVANLDPSLQYAMREIGTFTKEELNGNIGGSIRTFIQYQAAVDELLTSKDTKYAAVQMAYQTLSNSHKEQLYSAFVHKNKVYIDQSLIKDVNNFLRELSKVTDSKELKNQIEKNLSFIQTLNGVEIKEGIKMINNQN